MIEPKYLLKKTRRERMRKSIRKTVVGSSERPRLIIVRTNKFLYGQVIDDINHQVLVAASTLEKDIRAQLKSTKDKDAAKVLGAVIAERMKAKQIVKVVFDRNVYAYLGRVKIFADAAREKGIQC